MPQTPPVRRPAKEQNAIAHEYAAVMVEIMNLSGKYANCRLRMSIGASVGSAASILHLLGIFALINLHPMIYAFSYFFTLIGGGMTVFAIFDYFTRGETRKRITELEERRAFLRQRMFEAYVS
jgi:hypothetical protein